MCCYELYYVRLFTFILKITQFLYCFLFMNGNVNILRKWSFC